MNFSRLDCTYGVWKAVAAANGFTVYAHVDGEDTRLVWCGTRDTVYSALVSEDDFADYQAAFPSPVSVSREDDAIALIVGTSHVVATPRASDGTALVQNKPLEGSRINSISPNLSDKTTWYYDSLRVENEVLSDNGDHTTYELATDVAIVDVTHGKLTHENKLSAYAPVVTVDDVEKTENPPGTTDGDFGIDYDTGAVTFNAALAGTETVKMSYSKAQGSMWAVKPSDGKQLRLLGVEVQFSDDATMEDNVLFAAYAEVGKFPPFEPLRQVNGGPYPDGTMLPVGDPVIYKTYMDIINEANRSYPTIPKLGDGDNNWRGLKSQVHIFRWDYQTTTDLRSDWGMELRISLANDIPCGGWWVSTTLYHISEALV